MVSGVIARCVANGNAEDGIEGFGATPIVHSSAYANGQSGIFAVTGPVIGNVAMANTADGFKLSPTAALAHNTAFGNGAGAISNGIQVGGNACDSATCP